jgi:hypothetical protein
VFRVLKVDKVLKEFRVLKGIKVFKVQLVRLVGMGQQDL